LHGTTREGLFLSVCEIGNELKLPWKKLQEVTINQAPNIFLKIGFYEKN
jgi:hypothetical protein